MDDLRVPPLRWNAHEHAHFERGSDWYWALGIIAVATAITAIIFADVLFGILIIVAAFTMALISRTPPRDIEFEISEKGIRIDNVVHPYKEIIAFWVEKDSDPLLLIDTIKVMTPNLIIPLEGVDPNAVRSHLLKHVKEVEMKEPLAHKIVEFFGF